MPFTRKNLQADLEDIGSVGLELLVIGASSLGDAPRDDVEGERDWCSADGDGETPPT